MLTNICRLLRLAIFSRFMVKELQTIMVTTFVTNLNLIFIDRQPCHNLSNLGHKYLTPRIFFLIYLETTFENKFVFC